MTSHGQVIQDNTLTGMPGQESGGFITNGNRSHRLTNLQRQLGRGRANDHDLVLACRETHNHCLGIVS